MGNCCGSQLFHVNQTLNKSGHLSSARRSQSTSNTTSKRISNGSGTSQFLEESFDEDDLKEQILTTPDIKEFTLQELKVATRNFRNDVLLGEGGFGKVYKGMLNSSGEAMVVAIKKLRSDSYQGFDEWQSEVNFLGRLSHPNLVRLLGYCWEERELLLVYEFMQHGSLEHHLFGNGRVIAVSPLPWELRLKIAIGAARGLAFLHATDRRVIYRDFKTSNLLLDREYNAKLSDFGLAKIGPSTSQSHLMTKVMGTYGYAAPEYVNTGRLYMKSDVYAFGVVLVEILTGIRAFDKNRPHSRRNLADWVKPYLSCKRKLRSIIDGRLAGRYPAKAAAETAQLALKCLAQEPKNRPEMQQVVDALERIQANHTIPQHGQESWHHLFARICTRSST